MAGVRDDLGTAYDGARPALRVVSLVPSLTETLASIHPERVVGATDWCTHPADLATTRVRGTKNPDLAAIRDLRPDVVVANKEENRELDVRRLRDSGVHVWVTDIRTVPDAVTSIRRLLAGIGWPEPDWLPAVEGLWCGDLPPVTRRVVVPIWRDPWMVVGGDTFVTDLVRRLGWENAYATSAERYPSVTVADIEATRPDVVLLPDEPYVFTEADGPEVFTVPTELVSGRLLTWYGPSLVDAAGLSAG
ncbi:helical backbone metal receptor [Nocardioides ultimimeridianus]